MSGAILSTIYAPLVLFTFVDGTEMTAVGEGYESFDACMVQAEADAKIMVNEIEGIEGELEAPVIRYISISCEAMDANSFPAHSGYIIWETRYE